MRGALPNLRISHRELIRRTSRKGFSEWGTVRIVLWASGLLLRFMTVQFLLAETLAGRRTD
ncbi:hypothetical protein C0Q59_20470 [Streptomyces albidoflavus]|nr:hypothetical protein C0Q59_20470 [Streptomyces albidoflavus]